MSKFSIRRLQTPHDFTQVAELLNFVFSEKTSAQILIEEDAKIPAKGNLGKNEEGILTGHDRFRIVAEDQAGNIAGYGITWRAPWTAAGELNHVLIVHPKFRGRGIGSSLYKQLEDWAKQQGASRLNYEVREHDKFSVAFAHNNGFAIQRHSFESVLDLSTFDKSLLEQTTSATRIATFAEIQYSDKEEKLFELYKEASLDIPGYSGDFFDFSEWKKWTLDLPGASPEYTLIALDQGNMIGVVHQIYHQSTQSMYNEFTGVSRKYRGKGVGLALKIKGIELALRLNAKYIRTNNDSLNEPMLKINRDRLGFRAVPGKYLMIKSLRE